VPEHAYRFVDRFRATGSIADVVDRQAAEDHIEGLVLEGQRSHIAGPLIHSIRDALQLRVASCDLERVARLIRGLPEVDAHGATARQEPGRHEKDGPAPAAQVEDVLVATKAEGQQEIPPYCELPVPRRVEIVGDARGQGEPEIRGNCGEGGDGKCRTTEEDRECDDRPDSHRQRNVGRVDAVLAAPATQIRRGAAGHPADSSPHDLAVAYAFTPLREDDLDLIRRWLLEPHVERWWNDGVKMPYPDAEIQEYRDAIQGRDPTYRYLALIDARPAGMFQHYRIADSTEYAEVLALGEDAVGVDLFIGESDLVGRGHGPPMLREFLRDVAFPFHRIDVCVIGPSVNNTPAIRAYEKAGFRPLKQVAVPGEPDPEFLMRLTAADLHSLQT